MRGRKKKKEAAKNEEAGKTVSIPGEEQAVREQDGKGAGLKEKEETSAVQAEKKAVERTEEDLSARVAELEDQLLRLRAEYANFKRRTQKEKSDLALYVKAELCRGIIPIVDDFKRFFAHAQDNESKIDKEFLQGIRMIYDSLEAVLQKQGIKPVAETGVPFDPNVHEALMTEKVEKEEEDHKVLEVLEVGYCLGETVIRPAKVKVGIHG